MLVDRRGDGPDTAMVTTGLHAVLGQGRAHRCGDLVEVAADPVDGPSIGPIVDPVEEIDRRHHDRPPPHLSVLARWGAGGHQGVAHNLLGNSTVIETDDDRTVWSIPLIDADADSLLYYGALPVAADEILSIDGPAFPIWRVRYGRRYVDGCLLTERGGGFYLEWHTDRPHWHQPLSADASGFYLLARRVGPATEPTDPTEPIEGAAEYHLTAFRLPPGTAVFTRPGAIHCDAALTGTWAVGYADSQHYSTALVRNRAGAMVTIEATGEV